MPARKTLEVPQPESQRGNSWVIPGVFIALVVVVLILILTLPSLNLFTSIFRLNGNYTSTYAINTSSSSNPSLTNSTVQITYPSDYVALANYSLTLINKDRVSVGLSPASLSPIQSGQQHADSMLYYDYFSHWDTQGLKPYMRYTILNGTGFVEENVAYEYTSYPSYLSTSDVKSAISTLEYQMINNDSQCCQNGHKDNILNQYHNRVSIGIAYNSNQVYFVEDFETAYISFSQPIVSGVQVVLSGNTSETINPSSVMIFYDSTPTKLNTSSLNTQYYGPYSQGSFVGGILPPCNIFKGCASYQGYITVYASTWQVTAGSIDIQFSLSKFLAQDGDGVYTIYVVQGDQSSPEYLTSISVFESG